MALDLISLVNSFATGNGLTNGNYQVTRRTAGTFLKGIAQPTTDTLITIQASVQPATGEDLLRLPEGRRSNQTRVVFTTTQLYTGDQSDTFASDLISINGDPWEVQHVEEWLQANGAVAGYRCVAQEPTPNSAP
jgi:hypothetical protein